MRQAEFGRICGEGVHLLFGDRIPDGAVLVLRGRIVVRHAEDLLRPQAAETAGPQAVEGLGARHFVAVQPVDIQLVRAAVHMLDGVRIPDLVKQGVHPFQILLIQST